MCFDFALTMPTPSINITARLNKQLAWVLFISGTLVGCRFVLTFEFSNASCKALLDTVTFVTRAYKAHTPQASAFK